MAGNNNNKKTRGRQKIEIKMIENEDDRMVTFSKRRTGIYKKASELVTLTGVDIGILVFSQTGKPFSFGHPSIEAVINRYLLGGGGGGNNQQQQAAAAATTSTATAAAATNPLVEAHRQSRINELNRVYNDVRDQLDMEKERGKVLKQMINNNNENETTAAAQLRWWEAPVQEMSSVDELLQMEAAYDDLCKRAVATLNKKIAAAAGAGAGAGGGGVGPYSSSSSMPHHQMNLFATNLHDEFNPSGFGGSS